MKCTFNFQAGGGCKKEATKLVEGIPMCISHATAIAYRLAMKHRKPQYEDIGDWRESELTDSLRKRICPNCDGLGWIDRDTCPVCVGTGFNIL